MNKNFFPIILVLVIGMAVIGISAWYGRKTWVVPIRTVIITSPFPLRYDAAQIASKSLVLLDIARLRSHILQKNRDVSTVVIEKSYPETLILTVVARQPLALVHVGAQVRAIDEEGMLLSYVSQHNTGALPQLDAPGIPFYTDQKADWRIATAVTYLQLFRREHVSAKHMSVDTYWSQYQFLLEGNTTAVIPFSGNPGAIVASLQVILGRFRIEGKQVRTVDFRFDKPIITFQTGEKISS